jgi:CspA family cold shock protein
LAAGTVIWFNPAGGYGFIAADDGGDRLYVRRANIVGAGASMALSAGERVRFESRIGGMGPEAIGVSVRPNGRGGG